MVNVNKLFEASEAFEKLAAKKEQNVVFPANHAKVNDSKDHFPLNTEKQAKSALAQIERLKEVPAWFKGTLAALKSAVEKAVKKTYPNL